MKNYVVGFAIDPEQKNVLLIKKNRPAWQAGLLNGIGGKIEEGETPDEAMHRECVEECGLDLNWTRRGLMTGTFNEHEKDIYLHIFYAYSPRIYYASQITDEALLIVHIEDIVRCHYPIIDNLLYLVPFGMDAHVGFMRLTLQPGGFTFRI